MKNKIEKLEEKLKTTSDEETVDTLNALALELQRSDHPKAIIYAKKGLALAEKLGYKKGSAKSRNYLASVQFLLGDYNNALKNYKKSLDIYKKIGNISNIGSVYRGLGGVYSYRGDYNMAFYSAQVN